MAKTVKKKKVTAKKATINNQQATVEDKLNALHKLQVIDTDIDRIMSMLRSLLSSSDAIKNRTAEIAFILKQINKELENLEKEQKRV